ncbi:insulin-like [Limulus polyphemus]|uniref:Insulin-like n=1 Tax=Limulus polyphemus TaxID=6850 RepID=A0ABM1TDA3_LIMPO|nr:insulin-like [Limulus polyphemus]
MTTKVTAVVIPVFVVAGLLFLTSSVSSVRLCGTHLSEALALLCRAHGGFYSPQTKRSASLSFLERLRRDSAVVNQQNTLANRRFGVADECCRRACSLQTLTSYCAFPHAPEESSTLRRITNVGRQAGGIHLVEHSSQKMASQISSSPAMASQNSKPQNFVESAQRESSGLVVNPRTEEYILV